MTSRSDFAASRPDRETVAAPVASRVRVLSIDMGELTVVLCPSCNLPLCQDNLQPGSANRFRCRRCKEWTVVMVVAVFMPPDAAALLTGGPG